MRHFENIEKRLADLESKLHSDKIPTTDSAGNKRWLPATEKDILDIYVSLLEISAAATCTEPTQADIPPDLLESLGPWARAELDSTHDELLMGIRDEAKRLLASEAVHEIG